MRLRTRAPIRIIRSFVALLFVISAHGQPLPDFTGHWLQNANSAGQRQLDIQQNDNILRVETTVTNSKGTRRLEVTSVIGGPQVAYKGLDGDEFRSLVHWDGRVLVFDTIEHERGRRFIETTVWTQSDDRSSIQLKRHSTKSGKDSSVTYVRQP